MSPTTISLPVIRLASRVENVELSLQSSLSLDLPEKMGTLTTETELLDAVSNRHLWIARTGSCYLNVSVSVHDELLPSELDISRIAGHIQNCESWDRLGLRLQYSEGPGALSSHMAFSIQHPDLTSALVAPANALAVCFLDVSCSINMSCPRKDGVPPEPVAEKSTRPCKKRKIREVSAKGASEDGDIYDVLTTENHQAIDDFLSSLNLQLADGNQLSGRTEQHQHTRGAEEIITSPHIPNLLQTALKLLVFGGSGTHKGISVLEGKSFLGLKELVPAVFHFPYLETVSSRARLLPAIATSLARMANAESPALRLKVASFGSNVAKDGGHAGSSADSDSVICGIEKAAWETILATTKKPVLRSRRIHDPTAKRQPSEDEQGDTASQNLSKTPSQPENYRDGHMTTNEVVQDWAFSAEQSPCVKPDVPIDQPFFTSSLTSSSVLDSPFGYPNDGFVPESPFPDSLTTSNTQSSQSSAAWSMSPLKTDVQYDKETQESAMQIYDPGEFGRFEEWNMAMEAQYSVMS